jgi:hypothetical protein
MEITYQKYVQQIPNTPNSCPNFVTTQPKVFLTLWRIKGNVKNGVGNKWWKIFGRIGVHQGF